VRPRRDAGEPRAQQGAIFSSSAPRPRPAHVGVVTIVRLIHRHALAARPPSRLSEDATSGATFSSKTRCALWTCGTTCGILTLLIAPGRIVMERRELLYEGKAKQSIGRRILPLIRTSNTTPPAFHSNKRGTVQPEGLLKTGSPKCSSSIPSRPTVVGERMLLAGALRSRHAREANSRS